MLLVRIPTWFTAEEKKRIAADRERVVLDAIGDRSDPGYVELAAAEAWDAHQDLISAKAEVEGAHHLARKKFEEHHAAFAALVEIQRDEDNLG